MRRAALLALAAALLCAVASGACASGAPLTVATQYGPVTGTLAAGSAVREFLGVPFVAPPVGALRFADPAPPQPWTAPLDASQFKPGCPQVCDLPPNVCPLTTSEDCLYLNVFTPQSAGAGARLPVMVFIPGGRFLQGAGGIELYNSTLMASSANVVVVTISYRLGVLGFWWSDKLGGNFGLKDQLAALQWVKNNIANFGGDPTQVTIFGESAGATSVAVLMVSPAAQGLFARAIIESNPWSLPCKTTDEAESMAERFADQLGCDVDDAACLRGKSADDVVSAQDAVENHLPLLHPLEMFMPFTPIVDGELLTDQPIALFIAGKQARVPLMLGTVENEAVMFVYSAWNDSVGHVEYDGVVLGIFRTDALTVLDMYPFDNATGDDGRTVLSPLATDYIFACPTRRAAAAHSSAAPVFLYRFNHVLSFDAWGPGYPFCVKDIVCHGSELPFVFDMSAPFTFDPSEATLARSMMRYWTNFATSSDPNKGQANPPTWPGFTPSNLALIEFTAHGNAPESGYLASYCDQWDKMGYDFS